MFRDTGTGAGTGTSRGSCRRRVAAGDIGRVTVRVAAVVAVIERGKISAQGLRRPCS